MINNLEIFKIWFLFIKKVISINIFLFFVVKLLFVPKGILYRIEILKYGNICINNVEYIKKLMVLTCFYFEVMISFL